MVLYQLKCPGCGATLDVDEATVDSMFCKYCGNKILLADQSDTVVKAKADIIMQKEENTYKRYELDAKHEAEEKERKAKMRNMILIFLFYLLGGGMCLYFLWR